MQTNTICLDCCRHSSVKLKAETANSHSLSGSLILMPERQYYVLVLVYVSSLERYGGCGCGAATLHASYLFCDLRPKNLQTNWILDLITQCVIAQLSGDTHWDFEGYNFVLNIDEYSAISIQQNKNYYGKGRFAEKKSNIKQSRQMYSVKYIKPFNLTYRWS